ncbi:RsmB/NOP family class I SAM-dependent RNA methyltransferase [Pseudonocardia sp. GCM10023141]|uniref:RsmB/NOP family class I SAM-dependent RNA methyltransferase n=1 Tax=Pseudonocardia sp. GCM10023141 TaxID=3252653 RepID=UPI00361EC8B7
MTAPRRGGARRDGGRGRPAGPRGAGPPRGRSGPPRPPELDPSRQAALELLTSVRVRDAYANLALPAILRRYRLHDRDAGLATELGYGTLRAKGLLDAVIEACTDRPMIRVEPTLLDALRLGAYQLLRTRIPSHAAVDTTVELVRVEAGSRAAGFVNAILRKVGAQDEAAWVAQLAPSLEEDPLGHAAFAHAHPRWIAQAFSDALGPAGPTEIDAALAADDARPTVHLLARPGEITAAELALVTGGEEAPYSPYGVHLEPGSGDIGDLDVISEGLAVVQDEGSQLVALALAKAPLLGADAGRWLDLCAGPGGKAVLLGGLAQLDGAHLDAVESSEHRADLVRRVVDGLPVEVHTADGREAPLPDAAYDRVLVDAPCTGLGALRRRPEARWRRRPEDVSGLSKLQRELLTAALRHVRPGGVVAYVTCSPHLAETLGVLTGVVRKHPDVEQLDARELLPGVPDLGDGPTVQLWPHRHGTDAMFLGLLRKTA